MGFLTVHYDHALEINAKDTLERITAEERERLAHTLAVVVLAGGIPRRLGAEATGEDLALDKRRAKRVVHALKQCLSGWAEEGAQLPQSDEIKREAAQLDWQKLKDEHTPMLQNRIRYIVTWSRKTGADDKWTKKAVVRLTNEITWVSYALRD